MQDLISKWFKTFTKPIGILAAASLIAILIILSKLSAPSIPPKEQIWPIEAIKVSPQSYHPEILMHGRVESRQTTTLRAAVTGYIKSTPALEGAKVEAQAVLMEIDPIDATLLLEQREAEVDRIESELLAERNRKISDEQTLIFERELVSLLDKSVSREEQLSKRNLTSQSRVEEAELGQLREKIGIASRELALKNYEARLKQLQANLARATAERDLAALNVTRTSIKAPFSGIISQRLVSIGDRVQPNDALIEMYSNEALEIRAQVSTDRLEALSLALKNNHKVRAELIDKEQTVPIHLDRLAGEIELNESGIDALFVIDSDQSHLRLGEVVKLKALLPKVESVIALPRSSLFEVENKRLIYKVVDQGGVHRLQAVPVDVKGEIFKGPNSYVLISNSIENGALILLTRLPYARTGLKVQIRG